MKVIHGIKFSEEETEIYRRQVFSNLWEAMRACLEGMQELGLRLAKEENRVGVPFDEKEFSLGAEVAFARTYCTSLKSLPYSPKGNLFP